MIRDPNLFHVWLQWLRDLGGTYEPMRDLSEPKPPTGRRDPDKKPRQYEIGAHSDPDFGGYGIMPGGQVIRL